MKRQAFLFFIIGFTLMYVIIQKKLFLGSVKHKLRYFIKCG